MSNESNQNTEINKYYRYILIGLTIVSVFLAILFWRSPLNVYDTAGHISLIRVIASDFWPKMSGWNSAELLGWPAGIFYPSFFHWLAATLSFLVGVPVAVKLLIAASIVALPWSLSIFTKSLTENKLWSGLTTLILFLLLLLLPNFLGTGFRSLFQIGLLSNFFVLPFLFLFLATLHKKTGYLLPALLLAVIVLTHIVAAVVAIIYFGWVYKAKFFSKQLTRTDFVSYLKIFGLAGVLTAFFWIPFILNLEYTSVSRHVSSYFLPNVGAFVVSLTLGFYAWTKKEQNIFILSMFSAFIAFVAAVDAYLIATNGTSFLLYQFHVYRFQPFAYLLLTIAGMLTLSKEVKFDRWDLVLSGVVSAGFGLIVLILLVRSPSSLPNARFSLENAQISTGRFLETFRRTQVDPFWYGMQSQLNQENKNAAWAYGLFTDSSPNGPYLGSLIKSLNSDAYSEPEEEFLETKVVQIERVDRYLDHMGIGNLINLDPDQINAIGNLEKDGVKLYFNVEKGPDAILFEVPKLPLKPIKNNWDQEVEKWWLQKGEVKEIPYFSNGSEISQEDIGGAKVEIVETNESQTKFQLYINSDKPVPILAKISYFPYWKAIDKEGKEIQIYRTAPNLMLFEAKGKVTLEYKEPIWINWLYILSVVTLLGTVYFIYRQKSGRIYSPQV